MSMPFEEMIGGFRIYCAASASRLKRCVDGEPDMDQQIVALLSNL
jgi:hypothetical protein